MAVPTPPETGSAMASRSFTRKSHSWANMTCAEASASLRPSGQRCSTLRWHLPNSRASTISSCWSWSAS
jgi:hypothetical protein